MKSKIFKLNLHYTQRVVPVMVISIVTIGCSSHRYSAFFKDNNSYVDYRSATENPSIKRENEVTTTQIHESNLTASINKVPTIQTKHNSGTNFITSQPETFKNTVVLSKTEIKNIKNEVKRTVMSYKKANKPEGITGVKEMPRYKYLSWAAALALVGIALVAFSTFAEFLGVLGSLAFLGALVFLILWIIKK